RRRHTSSKRDWSSDVCSSDLDDIISEPYAKGTKFTSRPDDPYNKVTIESLSGDLQLFDGRMNHNNGWFVLRSNIKPGVTKGAVRSEERRVGEERRSGVGAMRY